MSMKGMRKDLLSSHPRDAADEVCRLSRDKGLSSWILIKLGGPAEILRPCNFTGTILFSANRAGHLRVPFAMRFLDESVRRRIAMNK